jgi:predicted dehydrogenase
MQIALIGTGFVADYYMETLQNHSQLTLLGAFDRNEERLHAFCTFHNVKDYPSLKALLEDPKVDLVLNLTNPESHFEISKAALEMGKHVYSEKPLAMAVPEAEALVSLARRKGLTLCAAPATLLGEAGMTAWRTLAAGAIGTPRLAYAEMEDGPVFRDGWENWKSRSGARWPGAHEFEIGCALEHAGYYLTWLCAFFGPARKVIPFAMRLFDEKGCDVPAVELASDYSIMTIIFESGTVARITCGLAAARDRSMQIIGDKGAITVDDGWNIASRVRMARPRNTKRRPTVKLRRKLVEFLSRLLPLRFLDAPPLPRSRTRLVLPSYPSRIDFMLGPATQATDIAAGKAPLLAGNFALHVTELALAMQNAGTDGGAVDIKSRFTPLVPDR